MIEDVEWNHVILDSDQWGREFLVNHVKKLHVLQNRWGGGGAYYFLTT